MFEKFKTHQVVTMVVAMTMLFSAIPPGAVSARSGDIVSQITSFSAENMPHLAGVTWYVATTGNDTDDCLTASTPCETINGAISKAAIGDTINIATGTYTGSGNEVVLIDKDITLSGGWNTSFTVQNGMSVIDGQTARRGVYVISGSIGVIDYFIVQNGVACGAGGIMVGGGRNSLTLNNSIIRNNSSTCTGGGSGIDSYGTLILNNSTVSNNSSGGISAYGVLTLNNSTVSDNFCFCYGAGIHSGATTTLNNSTVSGNTSSSNGAGGIYNSGATLFLNNSTIAANKVINSVEGGGGLMSYGTVTLQNTIIAMNTAAHGPDCTGTVFGDGTIESLGYNLIGRISDCIFTPTTGDLVGTNASPIDPRFTPLQDNGGPTFTHALMEDSPAIDAGNPATCLPIDQRGIARPSGLSCDIGAYELYYLFTDVAETYWAASFIERLYNAGITGGCNTSPLEYCPEATVTRAQMAIFLEKGMHYPAVFTPVNVAPTFSDTVNHWAEDWIEALKNDSITSGCGTGLYCPEAPVTRAQMAVFLLKAKYGSTYNPPAVGASTGFGDIPTNHWAGAWIKQLVAESITSGCGSGNYCPDAPVTRAQMAVFLVRTFGLP